MSPSKEVGTFVQLRGADLPADYVMTPGGPRHASQVHHIERGHRLRSEGQKLVKVDQSGRLVADFGIVERQMDLRPLHELSTRTRRLEQIPGYSDNWIVYAAWENDTGTPISSFKTQWTVPDRPLAQDGQLIYIFNGIENSTMIYQPVLQWGHSPAGGGGSWKVASWYVDGDNGPAFHSDLVQVSPGEILVGVMTLVGQVGQNFDYNCEFENIVGSGLPIQSVEELRWCSHTLEVYGIRRPSNYPTRRIEMQGIDLRVAGKPAPLVWSVYTPVIDTGQAVRVVNESTSGQGQVDLYCYGVKTIAFIPNEDNRIELFYTSIDDGIYHKALLDPNDWSADQPVVQKDYAKLISGGINKLGLLEIYYVGTDNSLYMDWIVDPEIGWVGEHRLDGASAKQVSVAANQDGRLEVFYVGMNDKVYHNWHQGGGEFHGEAELGGFAQQLCAVSNDDGRIEVAYIGTNDALYHNWQTTPNGLWAGEAAFGGSAKQLTAFLNGARCLEIVYIGTNDVLYRNRQVGKNNGWSGEELIGGTAKQIALAANANGTLGLIYIGLDDLLYYRQENAPGGSWSAVLPLYEAASQVAIALNADGLLELIYIGMDGLIYHRQQTAKSEPSWGPMEFL